MDRTGVTYEQTRVALHRIAAHVLARRRWQVTMHFGLRAGPGGITTSAFGEPVECIRIAGAFLIHETGSATRYAPIPGSTLRDLAAFVGTDLDGRFNVGESTPDIGDPDEPIAVDETSLETMAAWYALGWQILDTVLGELSATAAPATLQLWPEHFDVGTNIAIGEGEGDRVNLGCSPGDAFEPGPYLYVGPWGPARPGDPGYWNASFGAIRRSADLDPSDPVGSGARFMRTGLDRFTPPQRPG